MNVTVVTFIFIYLFYL